MELYERQRRIGKPDGGQVHEVRELALALCANDARLIERILIRACEFIFPAGPVSTLLLPFSRVGGNLPGLGSPGVLFDLSLLNATREEMIMAWDYTNDTLSTRVEHEFLIGDDDGTQTDEWTQLVR